MSLPQLPQTPTDNLYKFMAIFGLTLLIVGLVVPSYLSYIERVNQVDLMAKVKAADMEMIKSGALRDIEEAKNAVNTDPKMSEEEKERRRAMIHMLDINDKAMDELRKSLVRNSFIQYMDELSKALIIAGSILIILGFYFWYYRLQVFQDVVIKSQAETSRRELLSQDNKKQENTEKQEDIKKQEDTIKNE